MDFFFWKKHGIRRITRDFPPSHYIFKVESFSLLQKGAKKYESEAFEAAGHKWRLSLYPNGDSKNNGNGFISLYLVIDETKNLPPNWEVNVSYRLFVVDQIRNKYLTIEDDDGAVKRFNWMKTELGFAQLLSLKSFMNTSNGYLVGDSCIFGAEIFLMEPNCEWECLSLVKQTRQNTLTLKMENFSKLDQEYYLSPTHTIESLKWELQVYPRGWKEYKGKGLTVFLLLVEAKKLLPKGKVYVEYKLRVCDQINQRNNKEFKGKTWFSSTSRGWGRWQLMSLDDLHDASKGYLNNKMLIVEAEIILIKKKSTWELELDVVS